MLLCIHVSRYYKMIPRGLQLFFLILFGNGLGMVTGIIWLPPARRRQAAALFSHFYVI